MEQFVFLTMDQRGEGGVGVPSYFRLLMGGRDGGTQLFPITIGCHTSTWHASELNNDHVLGNNTRTCGLRSILKHNA